MDYDALKNRLTPSNWIISSNDGTNLEAYNPLIGETFVGTLNDFNAIFQERLPDQDINGVLKVIESPGFNKIELTYSGTDIVTAVYKQDETVIKTLQLDYDVDGNLSTVTEVV